MPCTPGGWGRYRSMSLSPLAALAEQAFEPRAARMKEPEVDALLAVLPGWSRSDGRVVKTFRFGNYHETIAFVNAVAWIAQRADHHPDLSVHYDHCVVAFTTHDAAGITQRDLVCAARVERLRA